MKIKNQEWINFKKTIISFIQVFEKESIRFDYPIEDEEDFRAEQAAERRMGA